MGRDTLQIAADVDAIASLEEGDDLDRLSDLCEEYFASQHAGPHVDVWFRLYERFPREHGNGVFWSILHGLEAQPTSDASAVASVLRRPTHYPVLMLGRMLNAGTRAAAGVDLVDLLRQVADDARNDADVCGDARRYADHQRDGRTGSEG